ncbi:hypothetical protein B0H21DRAFT_676311, partial [Amylocystis lapponica]
REEQLKQEARERIEAEQRKPITFPEFRAGVPPPTVFRPCLAPIARKKLENLEYVELWYFTTAGVAAAEEPADYTEIEEFMTTIRPLTFRGHRVVKDSELSWRELTSGHVNFLEEIKAFGWPAAHCDALFTFFRLTLMHSAQFFPDGEASPIGEASLIQYQAQMRREWHDKLGKKDAFNIGIFSEEALDKIRTEKMLAMTARAVREV